ncbi:MAG: bifunctional (p)ppGpp synthetase/guanosine-3',5'-bis(diphosphate) 3'-pyrophosphohydrolase [Ruminococcaceae bacterium]|nr:bifunctional (p)ppGpp synthetase/guanosine-3',5'-bis(diphosphate) 3'-pyrophosphohydrolase [Oscillospiraceae bacterium]
MAVFVTYDDLSIRLHESGRDYDMDAIERAYLLANKAHAEQKRKSGEPYIVHPVSVAIILVELGMDSDCIVTALLHDVVEDTDYELSDIEEMFGKTIAELTDGVTKLRKINFSSREEHQAENLRKMLIAMNRDIRVIIIKLADRIHNMRTLYAHTEQKQRDIAKETMEIYAPIAHRLGIRSVKEELEDLSLRYLDPVGYNAITELLSEQQADREAFLMTIKREISDRVHESMPEAGIDGRIKSVHGIYRKMYIQQKEFSDIYDIYAVRIIVRTVAECYAALGVIHSMFIPIPNRFKDYITMPKPNGYRSLHTTVIRKHGANDEHSVPFEVQIRTEEMHKTAEFGIAAHWKYKVGMQSADSMDERLAWIRRMLENQSESGDATELMQQIKTDMIPEEVYVFTPMGDVKCLPAGATVIDFAYAIHSQVGHRMVGAKVNGKMVPFTQTVKTGDIVEIQTTKEITTGPKRDWLKIVKTGEAKSKIRSWFKNERREENITNGREELQREFKRNGIRLPDDKADEFMQDLVRKAHMETLDDFYAAIGYGGIVLSRIMQRIRDDYSRMMKAAPVQTGIIAKEEPKSRSSSEGVVVEGIGNCMIKMSRCCTPIPGDDIIGYITRGYGVSIHKIGCPNVPADIAACSEPQRWIKAHWAEKIAAREFQSTLRIYCADRSGLLADITVQLSNLHISIHALNSRQTKDNHAVVTVTITVNGREHLEGIISRLSKVAGVIQIDRSNI